MPIGKRWSWRHRVGVLLALSLLLHGCFYLAPDDHAYKIPGINGLVYYRGYNFEYYAVEIGVEKSGRRLYRYVYPGEPDFEIIVKFFRDSGNPPSAGDRSGVPGGSGTPPLPAVQ